MAALPYDTALIDASIQLYDDLSRSMIVDVFELVDVAYQKRKKKKMSKKFDRPIETRQPRRIVVR